VSTADQIPLYKKAAYSSSWESMSELRASLILSRCDSVHSDFGAL